MTTTRISPHGLAYDRARQRARRSGDLAAELAKEPDYFANTIRLPLDPVLSMFPPASDESHPGRKRQLAAAVGVQRRTVWKWCRNGISPDRADRIAVALGHHPAEIWGFEWWAVGA